MNRFRVVVLVLLGATAAGISFWIWRSERSPQPPTIDSKNLDPAIAKAIEENRKSVLRTSDSANAWGKLGMVFYVHDFTDEANLCFREAERLDQRNPRWPYFQGIDLIKNEPVAAIPKLQAAVELAGKVTAPRLRLAKVLTELGRFDEAEENLREVEKIEPNNAWVKLGLGRLYFEKGQPKESLLALESLTEDLETRKAARSIRLSIYSQLGEVDAAKNERAEINKLPDDMPMSDPWAREMNGSMVGLQSMLGQINQLLASGRGNEAAQLLVNTVERYPQSEEAWRFAGQLLLKSNDLINAEAAWRRVLQFSPNSVVGHYNFGATLFRKGQFSQAKQSFVRATELKPDHGMAFYYIGKCLEQEQSTTLAISAFQQAARCLPQSVEVLVALAEALARDGQTSEAAKTVERALSIRPGDEMLQQFLVKLQQEHSEK